MSERKLFRYLNIISSLQGVSLVEDNSKFKRHIFNFISIFTHLYFWQKIIGALFRVIVKEEKFRLFAFLFASFSYICFTVVSYQLKHIVNEFINYSDNYLRSKDKRKLIKAEIICLICFTLCLIFIFLIQMTLRTIHIINPEKETNSTSLASYWITVPDDPPILSFIWHLILTVIDVPVSQGYLIGSVMIYSYLVYVMYVFKISLINQLMINRLPNVGEIRNIWFQIINIKNIFEDKFNKIPFAATSLIFADITVVVLILSSYNKEQESNFSFNTKIINVFNWLFEISIGIPIVTVPILVSYLDRKLKTKCDSIQLNFIRNSRMNQEFNQLFDDIKSNLDMNLTGYGMFKLNKELVLGFMSSAVTFSVLFLQLTQP